MAKVSLTEDAAIMLRKYRWPGNIRQLKNIAEAVSALESSKIAPGADKCIVDADVLSRYIPKEEPNLLPAAVQQQIIACTAEKSGNQISRVLNHHAKTNGTQKKYKIDDGMAFGECILHHSISPFRAIEKSP